MSDMEWFGCRHGDKESFETATRMIAEKFDVNKKDKNGNTLLILVCGADEENEIQVDKIVKALIAAGADVTVANKDGKTALHEAADEGFIECVQMLVAAGANVLAVDSKGNTAEYYATRSKHHDCRKFLAKMGTPVAYYNFMKKNKDLFPNADELFQKLTKADDVFLPDIFKCGITGVLCDDPVVVDDGYIYERAALMEHLKTSKNSPKTKKALYYADKPQPMVVYKKMIADVIKCEAERGTELPQWCKCPLEDYRYYGVQLCNDGYLYNAKGLEMDDAPATPSGVPTFKLKVGRKIEMYEIQLAISDYKDIVEGR